MSGKITNTDDLKNVNGGGVYEDIQSSYNFYVVETDCHGHWVSDDPVAGPYNNPIDAEREVNRLGAVNPDKYYRTAQIF